MFGELLSQESLCGLTALSVLGRRLSGEEQALLSDAAAALTLADPRIWPLKLTRLLASYGSTLPAAGAGLIVQEEARVGAWTCCRAAEVLLAFRERLADRADDEAAVADVVRAHLVQHRFVWGFGTPFRSHDERLVALRRCIERSGRASLPHWRLFCAVAEVVKATRRWEPNIGMGIAASFLDLGMEPREIGVLTAALMQHMFMAQAAEGAAQRSDLLQKLPEQCVDYVGRGPRRSPRAARSADFVELAPQAIDDAVCMVACGDQSCNTCG